MRKKVLMHLAAIAGLALMGSANVYGGLDSANHSQWDQDFYFNSFGGPVPGSPIEFSVGFSTIADYDGRVLSNAAITNNQGFGTPLTTISTNLFSGTDANLYQIKITDPTTFSASIPSTSLVLALFDSTGKGLAASIGGAADAITGTNAGVTSPGIYYIGIADAGGNPQNSSAQNIFGLTGAAGVFTPVTGNAVLATDPQIAWTITSGTAGLLTNTSFTAPSSTITLTGAGFAAVPEPASVTMIALAGVGMLGRRRRVS